MVIQKILDFHKMCKFFLILTIFLVATMVVYFLTRKVMLAVILFGAGILVTVLLAYLPKRSSFSPPDDIAASLAKRATSIIHEKGTTIYIVDDFLSPIECRELKNTSKDLIPSPITRPIDDPHFRDSETMFFEGKQGVQQNLEQKISNFIGIPEKMGESSQIQRYRIGNQFKAHMDYFDPDEPGEYAEFVGDNGQRTWTFMIYLNNVDGGGATEFVDLGQKIYPQKGRAVIWNNLHPDGSPNPLTRHRGMPVTAGEKYIITKWFREKYQR